MIQAGQTVDLRRFLCVVRNQGLGDVIGNISIVRVTIEDDQ